MYNTNRKKILMDLFSNHQDVSFSTKHLIYLLKEDMDKSTIYRQLEKLENEDFIHRSYNETTKLYEYQYAVNCKNHIHLKCNTCGKIQHLNCKEASLFLKHLSVEHEFLIFPHASTIYGICKECIKEC